MTKTTKDDGAPRESFPIAAGEGAEDHLARAAVAAHAPVVERDEKDAAAAAKAKPAAPTKEG